LFCSFPCFIEDSIYIYFGPLYFNISNITINIKKCIKKTFYFSSLLGGFLSGGFCPVPQQIISTGYRDPWNSSRWVLNSPFSVGTPQSFQIIDFYNGGTRQHCQKCQIKLLQIFLLVLFLLWQKNLVDYILTLLSHDQIATHNIILASINSGLKSI
jgi:hypothetical protein